MVPNEEIFETLESYVDGALDAAGRAQVEKQLAGNPQLRKLVAELLETRNMLRQLPRASAPPDLAETFQGSLERSSLLGDDGPNNSDVMFRINRWPQIMSVAAIVLLAVGLAAIIYKVVLPQKSPHVIAGGPALSAPDATTETAMPRGEVVAKGDESAAAEARRLRGPATGGTGGGGGSLGSDRGYAWKLAAKPSDEPTIAAKGSTTGLDINGNINAAQRMKPDADNKTAVNFDSAGRPTVGPDELQMAQKRLDNEGKPHPNGIAGLGDPNQPGNEPLVLLVQAQDPRQANQDVTRYFATNHIDYVALGDNNNANNAPAPLAQVAEQESAKASAVSGTSSPVTLNGGRANDNGLVGNGAQQQLRPQPPNRAGGENLDQQARTMNRSAGFNEPANSGNLANNGNNVIAQQEARAGTNVQNGTTSPSQQQAPQPVSRQQPFNSDGAANNLQLGAVVTNPTGNGANAAANDGVAAPRGTAYRTVLTRRQIQQFKDEIARRDNEWTEERSQPAEVAALPVENPVPAEGSVAGKSAAAADEHLANRARGVAGAPAPAATPAPPQEAPASLGSADRRKEAESFNMKKAEAKSKLSDLETSAATTTQPAMPALTTTEPVDKAATSRPAVAAADPATDAVAQKKSLAEQPDAPAGAAASARPMPSRELGTETQKDSAKELERQTLAPAVQSPATQPTTMPSQLASQAAAGERLRVEPQMDLKLTADDTPRVVLIVVRNQPANLPLVNDPTTQPAGPAPTTAPAAKPDDGK